MRGRANDAGCNAWNAGDAAGGVRCRWLGDGVPMTADSTSWVAESASSAGFQSDLTIDEDAVDGLLTAEELAAAAEFDENLDGGTLYAEYRRLVAEQAALRRVATLVARGVEPSEVFGAVAEEMRR